MSIIRTSSPILVELIDPVNSFIIFNFLVLIIISNDLTQMVNFPTWTCNCNSHSPALLDLFLSSDTSICSTMVSPPLGNSDHVVVLVSIAFPINSNQDDPFHYIAYNYSHADWGGLCHHLRDVPWEGIFKLSASAAVSEFGE